MSEQRATTAPRSIITAQAYRSAGEPTAGNRPVYHGDPDPPHPWPHAVHRTIICVDVEGFGDRRRTHIHQIAVRAGLYRCLATAFARSQVRWEDCYHADRGDGVLILVPSEVPKALLATGVPRELATALTAHNKTMHDRRAQIRARLAIHAGEIHLDEHGVTGTAVTTTFRLLDAIPVRRALSRSSGTLAVITSHWFFDEVIRHTPASRPNAYRCMWITVKETTAKAWTCLPDDPYPPNEKAYDDIGLQAFLQWTRQRLTAEMAALLRRLFGNIRR